MNQPTILDMVTAYSQDAVEHGVKDFSKKLDYTVESLRDVEEILDIFSRGLPKSFISKLFGPSDEKKWLWSKIWGSYVGEVIRKKTGGKWDIPVPVPHPSEWALNTKGDVIFPIAKVYNRIVNGSEDNIWQYFQLLVKK